MFHGRDAQKVEGFVSSSTTLRILGGLTELLLHRVGERMFIAGR